MNVISLVEQLFLGKGPKARINRIEEEIVAEKAKIRSTATQLRGEIRAHQQMIETSSRVMQTMTAAMVMMEAKSGRDN